ncbi:hypothetical protein WJX84_003310 [Apatococcus fuscideae]|uniref:SET domain-containing protein n=1 Tax=Apatococcus fuscideae TaxID=2026836 RepID=A0AAW1SY16_9CHLO
MQDLAALFDKSAAVLQHSLVGGRYLVAKHHLEAGDVVLQCPVLLTAQLPSWRKRICYACHRMCQARLALRCKGCEQQLAGQAPSETQQRASAAVGAFEVLQDHAAELGKRERLEWLSALTFLRQALVKACWPEIPSLDELLPLVGRIISNSFGTYPDRGAQDSTEDDLLTQAADKADNASFFNHSCHPNCYVHRNPTGATIIAMQPIAVGQELTISYIDEQLPQAARMLALQRDFFFRCNCSRCSFGLREGSSRRKAKRG